MRFFGIVSEVIDDNIFVIKKNNKKYCFYLKKNMAKKYKKYLHDGVKTIMYLEKKKVIHDHISLYVVNNFVEISEIKRGKKILYYAINIIQNGIQDIVNKNNNFLFIDFEMNMQDYVPIKNFCQEIVEAGYLLTTSDGAIIHLEHQYIKPKKFRFITNRTKNFLGYSDELFNNAISFRKLYNDLIKLDEKYHPIIFVWGKSDIAVIKKCAEINELKWHNFHFIDLLQLHMNYFGLKEAPGLFNTWERYNKKTIKEQTHDSLEDAMITEEVFFKFKEIINGSDLDVNFKE